MTREDLGRAVGSGIVALSGWFAQGFWTALGVALGVFCGRCLGWL